MVKKWIMIKFLLINWMKLYIIKNDYYNYFVIQTVHLIDIYIYGIYSIILLFW